ncbi:MAG TPA: hypothetical protein VJY54_11915 [Lachnospiraceae bacterium]|nr:hypothetical protein [Lachnospiraceae bacterium]
MDGQNVNNEFNQQPVPQADQPVYQQQEQQPVYQQQEQQPVYQQEQPVYQQPVYQQPYAPQVPVNPNKASGLSIAGLIVGIVSICLFCLNWIASLIGLVGLILAIIGQVKSKSKLGVAAIIVSAVGIVTGIVTLVIVLAALGSYAGGVTDWMQYYNY